MIPWYSCRFLRPQAALRLFCFPYAGGGAPVFRGWGEAMEGIEVCAANLPGRGSRFGEAPLTSMTALLEALAAHFPIRDGGPDLSPFAFFGYSMGARIAFELARVLRRQGRALPVQLLLAACPAPQLPQGAPLHTLAEEDFLAELVRRNGIPAAVLQEGELLNLLLPVVRADLELYETAVYEQQPPLPCSITTFGGDDDPVVGRHALAAWSEQTSGSFQQIILPGDHFFLRTAEKQLLNAVSGCLAPFRSGVV